MGLKRKRLSSGLVGHWLTDDSDPATTPDHSGNLNHGTITGATWADGTVGRALLFDGNDYVNAGNGASLNITTEITLSAWIKTSYTAATQMIIEKAPGGTTGYNILHMAVLAARLYPYNLDTTKDIRDGNWHHVAMTHSAASWDIYADGVNEATAAGVEILTNSNDVYIGARFVDPTYSLHFNGSIDDIQIWKRALSADEILDIYTKGRQRHGI